MFSLAHRVITPLPLPLLRRTMKTIVIPNQSDNYSYLIVDDATSKAAAVDTFDVAKVEEAARKHGVQIVANLSTHHHQDHTGGNLVSPHLLYCVHCIHSEFHLVNPNLNLIPDAIACAGIRTSPYP